MPAWIGPALGMLSLLLTLVIWQSNRKQSREQIEVKAFEDLVANVNGLKQWQAGIDVKIGIFWSGVRYDAISAAKILHQPHPEAKDMDALIDKYVTGHLTGRELKTFIGLLERTRDDSAETPVRQLAASQMLRALHQEYQLQALQKGIDTISSERQEEVSELGRALDASKKPPG